MKTNPNMIRTLRASNFFPTLFTNVAVDRGTNEPWWEGLDDPGDRQFLDWQGKPWNRTMGTKAAHPNSRFTVSLYNCPTLSPEFDNPQGVPISAILLGGRRSHLIPLVAESFDWPHGVFMGARTGSETTAAAAGKVGVLRRDPMAMLPFCGYNMGDYFRHWINIGRLCGQPPRIFSGDNARVIRWVLDRINNKVGARETPLGLVPEIKDLQLQGLDIPAKNVEKLVEVRPGEWSDELKEIKAFLDKFGRHIPYEIRQGYESMAKRLKG
jgi:phosphoenolpyruvate carboxykinase (GTP)